MPVPLPSPSVLSMVVLLAHQSDWVAMVLVCIPLGAFAATLAVANRRADRDGAVDMTPPETRAAWRADRSDPQSGSDPGDGSGTVSRSDEPAHRRG